MVALSPDDPGFFWSAKLKVKRAYKHIQEIENWRREFLQANIDLSRAQCDVPRRPNIPADAPFMVMIKWPTNYVYENIGPMLGDAVHNLRAALDHLAAEIVGRRKGDITRIYFPMNDTYNALIKTTEFRHIERHAPHIAKIISENIKPYRHGGEGGFYAINQLDREDKHRVITIPDTRRSQTLKLILDENDVPAPELGILLALVGRDGQEKPLTPGSPADLYNQQYGHAALEICIGEDGPLKGEPIVPALHQLADLVYRTIKVLEIAEIKNLSAHGTNIPANALPKA